MQARDELTTATLRMALTAVTTEEVAGKAARELSDDEVLRCSQGGEEAARGGRGVRRGRARASSPSGSGPRATVLDALPAGPARRRRAGRIVRAAVAEAGASSTRPRQMGAVMKAASRRWPAAPTAAGRRRGEGAVGRLEALEITAFGAACAGTPHRTGNGDHARRAYFAGAFLRGRAGAFRFGAVPRALRSASSSEARSSVIDIDVVALAQARVGLAVGDVRPEPAVLDHHRLRRDAGSVPSSRSGGAAAAAARPRRLGSA